MAGNSGQWLLKPTIRIARLEDFSIINGRVTDGSDVGIEGAMISAQIFNGGDTIGTDDDELIVQAATITDSNGGYKLFVAPGTYNLIVYAEAMVPEFIKISTAAGEEVTEDFILGDSPTGTVAGSIDIN